jgi:nucleotidyltransferase/DNA polymerase involved in DNA repair
MHKTSLQALGGRKAPDTMADNDTTSCQLADVQVAAELRSKVIEATRGLTCSVGVAPNMMLAKIASDKNKPNGQCVVGATRDEVMAFIADLPIRKVSARRAHVVAERGLVLQACKCSRCMQAALCAATGAVRLL